MWLLALGATVIAILSIWAAIQARAAHDAATTAQDFSVQIRKSQQDSCQKVGNELVNVPFDMVPMVKDPAGERRKKDAAKK